MKQKCDKTIVIKFFVVLFAISFSFFANVFAQYYYFSSGGNTYQQGCSEVLEIRVNSQGQNVRGGRFHLVLDPTTTDYPQTDDVPTLRSFFGASTDTFIQWTSEQSPSWKGNDYTILQADRNNGESDYNGSNKLYANVNFKPEFSGGLYNIVFGMEYFGMKYESGGATIETTLSMAGGKELINPEKQELYRTGTFAVLQEPCVADTNKPTITNISISNGSTKKSHLSGLTFSLKDEGGVNGVQNVPYVWSDGGEWTGNVGGIISNQYGIREDGYTLVLNGNGQTKTITNTTTGVSASWNGKTWQNLALNADITISSEGLFDFGIEKTITGTFIFYDRAGKYDTKVITFNKPKGPELIPDYVSPKNNDIYVNLSAPIELGIKDDWAGVNSGTIQITLSGVNGTDYGPYVFSGADLNLSGVQGEADQPDYYISILNHEKFPTSGTIKVEVYTKDMEGTVDTIDDYSFSTRPDCTEFQCCDPVLVDLGGRDTTYYYNTGLIISGGNNPIFSGNEQNITGVIDCNAETDGLSVYNGQDNFVFFTDESILIILGTGVKGVLSGDVLTLSYIIGDARVIIDKPAESEHLSGGSVDVQWHLSGTENQIDLLSGYVVQIYSGEELITGGFVDGTGITEILPDGEYVVIIYPVDLGGHTGNQTIQTFMIDTLPECTGWYSMPTGRTSGDSVMVYLTGCSENIFGDTGHEFTSNTGYNFIFSDNNGNTGSLFVEFTGFDREAPIFELYGDPVYECQTGTVIISGAVDTGIGLADLPYSFDGINRSIENGIQIYSIVVTGVAISGYAIDGLGNQSQSGVVIYIQDSKPSATGFTVSALNGIDVDWKELSNATDGACGSGTMYATVTGGSIGNCTISGNILSYRPNDDYITGNDNCELTIYDDEGNFVTGVNVELKDVNKYPYIKLLSPTNGEIQKPGTIIFSWTGIGDENAISGYVYKIWSTAYDKTGELTGLQISVNLGVGAYNWYVYAIFNDGTTGGLREISSFNIIPAPSGGGGGGRLTKDKCPNGDFSDSYYDGTCSANGGIHGSANADICGVNISRYSTEQKFAYLYAYEYGITTICPIQDANIDGYLIRSHFAKMISEFAVNVLGIKPERGKEGCDKFNDIGKLNDELHRLVITSCELGLMGLESNGITPSKSFNPNDRVTRAQFGTVLSRLLFGGMYNVKDESSVYKDKGFWYKDHLQALKDYGIMTKIDGDWPDYFERRGWVMIMLERADNYGIFAGKVPAKNGVKALFD